MKQQTKEKQQNAVQNCTIYKLYGASQYIVYYGVNEVNFLLEEDAIRFAQSVTKQGQHIRRMERTEY